MKIQNQNISIKGEIRARKYDQTTLKKWQKAFNWLVRTFKFDMRHYILGALCFTDYKENVICINGLNALTKRITNTLTYTGVINKQALGTGTNVPSQSDTKLQTESYRNDTASATDDGKIAYITAYFSEVECDGNYKEFGNFMDGSAGADTGRLWTHVAVDWPKTNTEVLVVDCKYTFN